MQQNYGGINGDHGNYIVQTTDGYAFSAGAASSDGDLKTCSYPWLFRRMDRKDFIYR